MAPAPAPQADCEQGWTLSLEALYLSPYQSEGSYDESDNELGGRFSLGYQFSDCLFTKATYFGYSAETDSNDDLKVSYIDWVVGQHFNPSEALTLSPYVGLRYVNFEEDEGDIDFSGLGVVVGIDATRALANGFSLYGTAKQSIVFGTEEENDTDNVAFVSELGVGLQYDFAFSGVDSNIRLGVEGQWWGGVSNDDSESAGLAGFVLGANFRF